jgi:ABC-2 type transport system permease protein
MRPALKIASNEFSRIIKNPIVILFAGLMFLLALINAGSNSALLPRFESFMGHDAAFFYVGLGNSLWTLSIFFSFLSMCLAVISISDERNGSLRVLVSKPLYRRDVIIGKFLGLSTVLFLLMVLTVCLFVSLTMTVFSGPSSFSELILRAGSFIVLLFLNCCFTAGLVMFLGIFLNKAETLVVSVVFVTQECLSGTGFMATLGQLQLIDPESLYISAFQISAGNDLYTTSVSYSTWISHAIPYVSLMIIEVIFIVLISCVLFNRDEI